MDLLLLVLPLTQVVRLNMHWKKKVRVILRDSLQIACWSTIEINVGIVCACMPDLRLLIVYILPERLGYKSYIATAGSHNQSQMDRGAQENSVPGNRGCGSIDRYINHSSSDTMAYSTKATSDKASIIELIDRNQGSMLSSIEH